MLIEQALDLVERGLGICFPMISVAVQGGSLGIVGRGVVQQSSPADQGTPLDAPPGSLEQHAARVLRSQLLLGDNPHLLAQLGNIVLANHAHLRFGEVEQGFGEPVGGEVLSGALDQLVGQPAQ